MESKFFKIGDIFNVEKGLLQSSKNVVGQFDFITASAEWKTHNEYSHDCEALVFAAGAAGSLGRTHYVNGKFIASDLCFVLTPKDNAIDKVDLKFYFYYFNLNRDTIVKNTATGTSKLAINMKNFMNYCIPLPSIEYQKLEKRKIEEVEPKINELDLTFEKNLAYITRFRQSILQEAVQGKLVPQDPNDEPASILLKRIKEEKERLIKEGKIKKEKLLPPIKEDEIPYELPKGWEWVRLGEVIQLISGQHILSGDYNEVGKGIGYLTGPTDFGQLYTNITKWTEHPKTIANKNDILITVKGSGVGKLNILTEDAAIGRQLMAIRPIFINNRYTYFTLSCNQDIFQNKKVGIAIPGISREDILNLLISVPPLNEQKRIVEKVDQLMALCDELEKNIEQCKKDSELLMQSVLQEAFKEK
ncbi:restriction endonuclease subunit S [Thermoanaerobacterium thermosaccharolyticum]|uniref:restriction endonuclease subunit S n=1 Tax=Thermoanaerobacterium thermosaccharolyticum TaxID=1517 RepID=UPI003D27D0C0